MVREFVKKQIARIKPAKDTNSLVLKIIFSATLVAGVASVVYLSQLSIIRLTGAIGETVTVSSVLPDSGPTTGGNTVTIVGTNFWSSQDVSAITAVRFNGVLALDYTVLSDTSLTAKVPPSIAGEANVTITTVSGDIIYPASSYTYEVTEPYISGVSSDEGLTDGNDTLDITGSSFRLDFVKATAESTHTLAIDSIGNLYAWGGNDHGQIGNGVADSTRVTSPWKVNGSGDMPANAKIIDIAAGYEQFSLAIDTDGNLYAWGNNNQNQIGNGDVSKSDVLMPWKVNGSGDIAADTKIVEVSAGFGHSMALDSVGNVYIWGYNTTGQVGNGESGSGITVPLPWKVNGGVGTSGDISSDTKIIAIAAGHRHSTAIDAFGNFYAWGQDGYGQIGNGDDSGNVVYPWKMNGNGGIDHPITTHTKIVAMSGRFATTIIVDSEGNMYTFGLNDNGQIGNGEVTDTVRIKVPWKVNGSGDMPSDAKIVSVVAASNHSLALDSAGNMYAWGKNAEGQVGNGDSNGSPVSLPWKVNGGGGSIKADTKILSIAGFNHSIAIDSDGNLHSWGRNNYGQVGDGLTSNTGVFLPWLLGKSPTDAVANISFGNVSAISFSILSDTSAIAVTPLHTPGTVDIRFTMKDNSVSSYGASEGGGYTFYSVPGTPILTVKSEQNQILISWTTPPDNSAAITSYTLQRSRFASFAVPNDIVEVYKGLATSVADVDVEEDIVYYYRLSAANKAGSGSFSGVEDGTLAPESPDTGFNLVEELPPGPASYIVSSGAVTVIALVVALFARGIYMAVKKK